MDILKFSRLNIREECRKSLPPDMPIINFEDFSCWKKSHSLPDIVNYSTPGHSMYPNFHLEMTETCWSERRDRIDSALCWLRSELEIIREQDKLILTQLQLCQDTIEQLKRQRLGVWSDDETEDEGHWEDWEISEYDRSCSHTPERLLEGNVSLSTKDLNKAASSTPPVIRKSVSTPHKLHTSSLQLSKNLKEFEIKV